MRTWIPTFVALLLAAPALAADANTIMAEADAAMNRADDQTITWQIVNMKPGAKEPENMLFVSQVKKTKTLTSFDEPANLKGTRVLVLARSQMYIYLPQYQKVRRIASHVTKQGFMGTSFSQADMNSSFGDVYDATLVSEADGQAVLELKAKPDSDAPYAKAMVTIDTEMDHPLELKYFNDKGENVKTEKRTEYECNDEHNVCLAGVMRMEDHTRSAWTELRRKGWELNSGLSDDVFTTRNLQRGE